MTDTDRTEQPAHDYAVSVTLDGLNPKFVGPLTKAEADTLATLYRDRLAAGDEYDGGTITVERYDDHARQGCLALLPEGTTKRRPVSLAIQAVLGVVLLVLARPVVGPFFGQHVLHVVMFLAAVVFLLDPIERVFSTWWARPAKAKADEQVSS